MRILASKDPRSMHTDPAPFQVAKGDNGARCSAALLSDMDRIGVEMRFAPRAEYIPVTADPANPILTAFREGYDGSAFDTHEWLFQLARHWAEWASPRIGTFPLAYRDPSGPGSREDAELTGEDSVYWEIADVVVAYVADASTDPAQPAILTRVEDYIVHAVAVLNRLDDFLTANGKGI